MEAFQRKFLRRLLFFSVVQPILQGVTTELIRKFLTTDIETGSEVFRIRLKNFGHKKRLKPKVLTNFCKEPET